MSSSNNEEIGSSAAFTLASLLTTISTIFISVLASGMAGHGQLIFGLIGFLSVSAAALIVDWVLDDILELEWQDRIIFLNGGYVAFSITMSLVAFGILYSTKYALMNPAGDISVRYYLLFGMTSACLFFKTMIRKDRHGWLIALAVFALLSFSSLIFPAVLDCCPQCITRP